MLWSTWSNLQKIIISVYTLFDAPGLLRTNRKHLAIKHDGKSKSICPTKDYHRDDAGNSDKKIVVRSTALEASCQHDTFSCRLKTNLRCQLDETNSDSQRKSIHLQGMGWDGPWYWTAALLWPLFWESFSMQASPLSTICPSRSLNTFTISLSKPNLPPLKKP